MDNECGVCALVGAVSEAGAGRLVSFGGGGPLWPMGSLWTTPRGMGKLRSFRPVHRPAKLVHAESAGHAAGVDIDGTGIRVGPAARAGAIYKVCRSVERTAAPGVRCSHDSRT